jgi:very-short-patch-repair endonuclease
MCTSEAVVRRYRTLRDEGFTRAQIDAALRAGSIVRVRRGVYATPGVCEPVQAAVAHGGVLACVSAARHTGLWTLEGAEDPVHVWLTDAGHAYARGGDGCVNHWDEGVLDGFGLPSVPRMLAQILACCGVESFFVALESALRLDRIAGAGLAWLHSRVSPEGRSAIAFARADADSGLESLVQWRLRGYGLRVRTQVGVAGVGRVDLLIGDSLLVEVDGAENHAGPDHRHKDLVRDANAAMWGYSTLRFDYALVVHDWDLVERAILGRLAALVR